MHPPSRLIRAANHGKMPGMLAAAFLLTALFAQEWILDRELPSRLTQNELAKGKALYGAYCESCHGADGDDARAAGITPLSGLSLRLGDPRIRPFGGPSFRARGRVYPPEEASALMAYILTLRGEKAFPRGDALVSPGLLNRKLTRRTYLVIDVRSEVEFRKGHIVGAANLPPKVFGNMVSPALAPALSNRIVVLYDEGQGLQAAKVWRALFQSGHGAVGILDGGFNQWVSEDRDISPAVSASTPATLLVDSRHPRRRPPAVDRAAPILELRFDWLRTANDRGLLKASELTEYFESAGFKGAGRYRLRGGTGATDLFAFQMYLLGYWVQTAGPEEVVVQDVPPKPLSH